MQSSSSCAAEGQVAVATRRRSQGERNGARGVPLLPATDAAGSGRPAPVIYLLAVALLVAGLAGGAIPAAGAEPTGSRPVPRVGPPVPANSICREYNYQDGLAAQDSRIVITLGPGRWPSVADFSGAPLNYLYAKTPAQDEFDLSDVRNNRLQTGYSIAYMRACAVNPGPAMPPFTSRSALLAQQYRDFLERSVTNSDRAYWAASGASANQIVSWFVDQEAARRGPLVRLYRAYFKRWPDAAGQAYWVGKMRAGTSLTKVSDSFAAVPEFKSMYGSRTNAEFVTLVYNNVLGRDPDAAGHAYWLGRLNRGAITRGGVMLQFSESPENKTKYGIDVDLVGITLRMLRRPPTPTELAQWRPNTDAHELAALLLASSEYAGRITP